MDGRDNPGNGITRELRRSSDSIRIHVEEGGTEILQRYAEEWRRLCERAQPEMALLRPETIAAYHDAFAPSNPVVLVMAWRDTELVALLPLQKKSIGAGRLRFQWLCSSGNVHFPRFDQLIGGENGDLPHQIWRTLDADFPRLPVQIERMQVGGGMQQVSMLAARAQRIVREHDPDGTPYIELTQPAPTLDDLIAMQGKKLRSNLRRGLKRLEERGPLEFYHVCGCSEGGVLNKWLDRFIELEDRGWKGMAGTSIGADPGAGRFYRALANDPDLSPHFSILALTVAGEMVAAELGVFLGTVFFGLKIAVNEQFHDCSPGHVMQLYELMEFGRLGARVIDMGGRADGYKLFWTDTVHRYSTVFIFPKGWRGPLFDRVVFGVYLPLKDYLRTKTLPRRLRRLLSGMRPA